MTKWVVHPIVFTVYPIVFLFARNADHIGPSKIVRPLIVSLAGAILLYALARFAYREPHRAGIATSGLLVLFFSYGHAWSALRDGTVLGVVVGRDLFLLSLWAALAVGVVWGAAKVRQSGADLTRVLNLVAIGLVGTSLWSASAAYARREPPKPQGDVRELTLPEGQLPPDARDIYYLIFDRYGSERTLREEFGFDNSPFLDALRSRGFYIASDSVANYPKTAHSLSATLGMDYLDRFAVDPGPNSSDRKPLYASLTGHRVGDFLRSLGYRHIHIGSWWDPTANDSTAALNYHYDKRSEFTVALFNSTLLLPVGKRLGFAYDRLDPRRVAANQILFQLEKTAEVREFDGPTFTFTHLMLPHAPQVFDERGNFVPEEVERSRSPKENYIGQLRFANMKMLELVDRLQDAPADEQPIIVLQSDEGPHPERLARLEERFVWAEATDQELTEKLGILNAYYLPGLEDTGLYPSISAVNTFRLIFDRYFLAGLGLLPDRAYVYRDSENFYDFIDVTERVRR